MRKVNLLLLIFAVATVKVQAADIPLVGVWKLNPQVALQPRQPSTEPGADHHR